MALLPTPDSVTRVNQILSAFAPYNKDEAPLSAALKVIRSTAHNPVSLLRAGATSSAPTTLQGACDAGRVAAAAPAPQSCPLPTTGSTVSPKPIVVQRADQIRTLIPTFYSNSSAPLTERRSYCKT